MKKIYTFSILLFIALLFMSSTIDLNNLFNYANQTIPAYIQKDNTTTNPITDEGATLGRVLFYDKKLSSNNTISCASCHQQQFGFSDLNIVSTGVNGVTGRHSMRLINSRFAEEDRFFWDERAATLEQQTTQPIQDHAEMGFSGTNGDPSFSDLLMKMDTILYYDDLFTAAFGDSQITEVRMQNAMAQFIRSIQSFDSKYDAGVVLNGGNINGGFSNFTPLENQGKMLFTAAAMFEPNTGNRIGGGLSCNGCHRAPEFDIRPGNPNNGRNNGVITVANNPGAVDLTNQRSPTLRDLFSPTGVENGPLMHDGSMATFDDVLDHYDDIDFDPAINPNLDPGLRGNSGPPGQGGIPGPGQNLLMTQGERDAVTAFVKTLSGNNVYTDEKWSDPFDANGNLLIVGTCNATNELTGNLESYTYQASNSMTTNGDVTTVSGVTAIVQAGQSVTLNDGVHFESGSDVSILLEDCVSSFQTPTTNNYLETSFNEKSKPITTTQLHIYPNPFKNHSTIDFELNIDGNISLSIFDINGQLMSTLIPNSFFEKGKHQVEVFADDWNNGVYFVYLNTSIGSKVEKLMVVK